VHGALASGDRVRMSGFNDEAGTSVVKHYA
jgi:hypothetical protein